MIWYRVDADPVAVGNNEEAEVEHQGAEDRKGTKAENVEAKVHETVCARGFQMEADLILLEKGSQVSRTEDHQISGLEFLN